MSGTSPYDVDWLSESFTFLPRGWSRRLSFPTTRLFISPEEALRRTPEADVDDAPRLVVVDDPEWAIANLRAEQLEHDGRLLEATNLRTRAICARLNQTNE